MADQFFLRVTAGPTYDASTQQEVHVNTDEAVHISTKEIEADIKIRIQNYRGPPGSHTTSPYFAPGSKHEHDLYSIAFSFSIPSSSSVSNGQDLVFGNDFDHPVRDKLPPGFGVAFKFATSYIDPGLYGDVYADEPYLYSPLLSTINTFRVSKKSPNAKNSVNGAKKDQDSGAKPIESSTALAISAPTDAKDEDQEDGVDEEDQSWPSNDAERRKYFLKDENRKQFSFETDKEYICDFFNPYLDFNDFALKLPRWGLFPGLTLPILSRWDGQPLRYVLKNRTTDKPLFVIILTLTPKEQPKAQEDQIEAQPPGLGTEQKEVEVEDGDLD
ncbi:hypothetical protein LTR28_003880 [Elasticomyces elasticus]|nr:hypothetical protein LTR28_003880 [Elasticomyces elasticus]